MRSLALRNDPTNGEIVVSYGSSAVGHSGKVILLTREVRGTPPTEITRILGEGPDLHAAITDAVSKMTNAELQDFPLK